MRLEARLFNKHPSIFNHYVASHPNGDVLQTTFWGDLKETTGWQPLALGITNRGQLQASALILKRPIPLRTGHSIYYSPRGPLFSNQAALAKLIDAVTDLARSERPILWKMDPAISSKDTIWNSLETPLHKNDTGLDFNGIQPRFVMQLDIRAPLETLLANMKSKTRYNIRYSERKGVKVTHSRDSADLEIFYPLLQETAVRDHFTVRSFEYFKNIWEHLIKQNVAQLFLAYHKNQPLGGTIAFRLGKKVWYVYGASSNYKRNLQASYKLQWEMIKWAKGSGCQIYDFRGVSGDLNPANPLYGLYRFKDGFGAHLVEYAGEYDLPLSNLYRLWQPAMKIYKKIANKN